MLPLFSYSTRHPLVQMVAIIPMYLNTSMMNHQASTTTLRQDCTTTPTHRWSPNSSLCSMVLLGLQKRCSSLIHLYLDLKHGIWFVCCTFILLVIEKCKSIGNYCKWLNFIWFLVIFCFLYCGHNNLKLIWNSMTVACKKAFKTGNLVWDDLQTGFNLWPLSLKHRVKGHGDQVSFSPSRHRWCWIINKMKWS